MTATLARAEPPSESTERPTAGPTRAQVIGLLCALLFLAGVTGWIAGARTDRPGQVEAGFLRDMTAHHQQAIELSLAELANGADTTARAFAQEIIISQQYEIGVMTAWLDDWGVPRDTPPGQGMAWMGMRPTPADEMPGMASIDELRQLWQASGAAADALFLKLMIDHHEGGVHMAEYAARHAGSTKVQALAQRMAANQRSEIIEMTVALERLEAPGS